MPLDPMSWNSGPLRSQKHRLYTDIMDVSPARAQLPGVMGWFPWWRLRAPLEAKDQRAKVSTAGRDMGSHTFVPAYFADGNTEPGSEATHFSLRANLCRI